MELTNLNESVRIPKLSIKGRSDSDRLVASGSAFDLYVAPRYGGVRLVMTRPGTKPRERYAELLTVAVSKGYLGNPTGYDFWVHDTRYSTEKTVRGQMESGDGDDAKANAILNRVASEVFGRLDPDDKEGSWDFLNKRLVPICKRIIPNAEYDKRRVSGSGRLLIHGKNW